MFVAACTSKGVSSNPTGTRDILSTSNVTGTGLPQPSQKAVENRDASAGRKVLMRSMPRVNCNRSCETNVLTAFAVSRLRRQREQWHCTIFFGMESISNATAPQRQLPRRVDDFSFVCGG